MDLSTIIGIVLGISSLVVAYVLEGGSVGALLQPTAAMIVFGGTIGAVVLSYSFKDLANFPKYLKILFSGRSMDFASTYHTLTENAEKARREGLLSLEQHLESVNDLYLRKGLQLIVDGTDPELTRTILENEISAMEARHKVGISMFEAAGGYSPTMGIIGTVMGLVHVLGNLSNPDALGPSIAMAFIATLYGVGSANLLWLPMGAKLKNKSTQEVMLRELVLDGIISIQAGENPSLLREKLKVHLGPSADKLLGQLPNSNMNASGEAA